MKSEECLYSYMVVTLERPISLIVNSIKRNLYSGFDYVVEDPPLSGYVNSDSVM